MNIKKLGVLDALSDAKRSCFLFFMGAVATYIILRLLIVIWLWLWHKDIIAITVILLSGVAGGFLTEDPIIGAAAGFVGFFPFYYYLVDGTISPVPHLLVSIGGFIGGLLRKKLFRRRKDKKTVAEGPVDDARGRDILKP